jgi:hypothetical protein
MKPPVAILVYVPTESRRAVFYPFASFSPEWSAIQYALRNHVPLRFIDLPQSHQLAAPDEDTEEEPSEESGIKQDPFGFLAEAAGYSDSERWWENIVELRRDDLGVFDAILEGTTALRQELGEENDLTQQQREAHMRQSIRKAKSEGYTRIAVVCGAWHAPALVDLSGVKIDKTLLAGLAKVKVAATWAPWTYDRLSYQSGYGAGVESPGWYEHLWESDDNVTIRWMTKIGWLLREHDLSASPAHIVEAVRLAETLASLRGMSSPSLVEMNEAAQTIFSFGNELQMRLIREKLIIGSCLGAVPPETPMVPLQADIERTQKQLRLSPDSIAKVYDLDLRKDNDRSKSYFLHRMSLLGIQWGMLQRVHGARGTFHEIWELQWHPEFTVAVIEAAMYGNTVESASENRTEARAGDAADIAKIADLLNTAILADLHRSVNSLMLRLEELAALSGDVGLLMDSVPSLVNIERYGNVRKSDVQSIKHVLSGMVTRIAVGLTAANTSLDDEAATAMFKRIKQTHAALVLAQNEEYLRVWLAALEKLANLRSAHGLVAGRACRILLDSQIQSNADIAIKFSLALSRANEPTEAGYWVEGFLQDSGQLLILDEKLNTLVDEWICGLSDEEFIEIFPVLRRTFSTFSLTERKQLGERVKAKSQGYTIDTHNQDAGFDDKRGAQALPLIIQLLGIGKAGLSNK